MSEPFISEIRMFGGTFAPVGWLMCNGQILPISDYTALYNLIGTTYGGDGQTTFGLPDLRGRMPIHQGPGNQVGESGGTETVTLVSAQMPAHSHTVGASSVAGTQDSPANGVWANSGTDLSLYNATVGPLSMAPAAITIAGGSQPHDNMMPFTTLSFIIATDGIYPSFQ
jgi:microcystin-dependent protein